MKITMKKQIIIGIIIFIIILLGVVIMFFINNRNSKSNLQNSNEELNNLQTANQETNNADDGVANYQHVTADTTVGEIVNNPAFNGFGEYIFPLNSYTSYDNMKISNINSLLPYHSHINTDTTIEVINYMLDEVSSGETIFYDIYSDEEKREDPSKEDTGLFFFRGKSRRSIDQSLSRITKI